MKKLWHFFAGHRPDRLWSSDMWRTKAQCIDCKSWYWPDWSGR